MLIAGSVLNLKIAYEKEFAHRAGVAHAVAFSHARTGLSAILSSLGLNAGDEVILPPLTCKVVPLTLLSLQLKPVYADISPDTLNLDPASLEQAIGPRTRAVLFQHTYGNPAGIHEVARIAAAHELPLIEDRAQCLPSAADGIAGRAAIFSNNLLKPLPAGSGGIAATNDPHLHEQLQRAAARLPLSGSVAGAQLRMEAWLHRHVLRPRSYWLALGLTERISGRYQERSAETEIRVEIMDAAKAPSDYQMREGARWLARLDWWASHRMECCADYRDHLAGCRGLQLPAIDFHRPLYYFPIRTKHKQDLLREARRRRIEVIAWPKNTPIYPIETEAQLLAYGFNPLSCPAATVLAQELIGLPTHDRITARHRRDILNFLRTFS